LCASLIDGFHFAGREIGYKKEFIKKKSWGVHDPDDINATLPRCETKRKARIGGGRGNARKWTTRKYSSIRARLAVVVTTTKPFACAHLKMTWPDVPPILRAIAASTGSTGPPGYAVMGLLICFRSTKYDETSIICRSPAHEKVKGEETHARVPYASVTMPCFAENSKTSFHDA
jgi:hypothetical protein